MAWNIKTAMPVTKQESLTHLVKQHLLWKDKGRPSSIRRTLEPFQRWHWGNFWEMGWSAYGLFQAHRYQLELNWTVKIFSPKIISFTTTICTTHSWPGQLGSCYCHTHTHARTHARTHACAHTHTHTHAYTRHAHMHTHTPDLFTPLFTCQYFGQKLSVMQGVCQ